MVKFSEFIPAYCNNTRKEEILKQINIVYQEHPEFQGSNNWGSLRDWVCCEILTPAEHALCHSSRLTRFIDAHNDPITGFDIAINEIKNGNKTSHWMWYIFPQMKNLECDSKSNTHNLESISEAIDYLKYPLLKNHLIETAKAILNNKYSVNEIFGKDSTKVKNCFILFNSIEKIPELDEVIKQCS